MKNILLISLILSFCITQSYSQVKKPAAKKPVTTKPAVKTTTAKTTTAKTNTAVAKPKTVQNKPAVKTSTAKKIMTPAKAISKPVANTSIPNQPVNNVEITNASITGREQQMIDEINQLRTNPAKYCTYVETYLQKYDADEDVKIAAKEVLTILKSMKPLTPLTISPVMYNDAKQHGLLMSKKNVFEHSSLPYAENLSLGYKDIRDAIVDLLIDDGIPNRGHRKNLLSEKIKQVAVFELPGKVQDIGYCYVQEFK